jgi:tRNA threonylcarbamoyladenosine biosynthesis protein TsaE
VTVLELCTAAATETKAVAAALAALVRPGDLVLLEGEMGAGKTAFVQGFAAALGVSDPVTSPTFTLHHEYDGRLTIHHLDVYRLEHLAETVDLALSEILDDGGVTVIEWGAAVLDALPADYLELRITFGDEPDDRRLAVRVVGASWAARWGRLGEALEVWRC